MRRCFWTRLAVSVLLTAIAPSWADDDNQLTNISLSPAGDIIFSVVGEGFDPQLETRPLPDGRYQITISARKVSLNGPDDAHLGDEFQRRIPAIQEARLSSDLTGFQLNLTSWRQLQPQVKSNDKARIIITLVGNHQLPAAVITRQQREAERQKLAEIKRRQLELEARQRAKAEKQRQEAAERKRKEAEAARLAAEKKRQAEAAVFKVAQRPRVPSIPVGKAAIENDWQTAYQNTPVALQATQDDLESLPKVAYDFGFPKAINTPFTPKMLAQDNIPTSKTQPDAFEAPVNEGIDETDAAPVAPLRLRKTPDGYDSAFQASGQKRFQASDDHFSEYATFPEPAIRRAWQDLQEGRPDNAEIGLRSFLEKDNRHVTARYMLALTLLQPKPATLLQTRERNRSRLDAARQEFLTIMNQQSFLPAYLQLVNLALTTGDLSEAERLLEKALPLYPQEALLWFQKGRTLEEKKDLAGAKSAYINALALDAHHPEFHYRLAQIYLKTEDWNACRRELFQTLTIVPDDARCWKLLGYLAEKQDNPKEAAQWYQTALQPDVMIRYGRLLEKQHEPKQALAIYQAVESIAGEDADLLFSLGLIYVEAKHPDRAEAVLRRFIGLRPDSQDTRVSQAKALLKQIR